ncbi:MAG: hypothetical protein QG612_1944 [Pseudomonadota bacterium]|nr:hypothetical protein [Pseudomonadota bacterium]
MRRPQEDLELKRYKIFRHPDGALDCVSPGWSWPAFGQGALWVWRCGLWHIGLVGLAVLTLVGLRVPRSLTGAAVFASVLLLGHGLCGLLGAAWRTRHLVRRGYQHADTVTASDPARAMALAARYHGGPQAPGERALSPR